MFFQRDVGRNCLIVILKMVAPGERKKRDPDNGAGLHASSTCYLWWRFRNILNLFSIIEFPFCQWLIVYIRWRSRPLSVMHHKLFLSVTQLNRYLVTFELFSFKKKLNNSDSFKHFIALKHFKFLTLHSMYLSLSKSKETESDSAPQNWIHLEILTVTSEQK